MDDLPLHLQSRIYGAAGVSGVCTTSREEHLRAAVLADQRDIAAPLEESEDGPAAVPTWRVTRMVCTPPDSTEQHAAALTRTGQRFRQLQHVSIDMTACHTQRSQDGLQAFVHHVLPTLRQATRLTIRGASSCPFTLLAPRLQRGQVAGRSFGQTISRLDVTLNETTVAALLLKLSEHFPAVQLVRVRPHLRGVGTNLFVHAPPSLTRLCVLLPPSPSRPERWRPAQLTLLQAAGLQHIELRFVPSSAAPAPAARDRSRSVLRIACHAPALSCVLGLCRLPQLQRLLSSRATALRHVEAAFDASADEGLADRDVRTWLCEWTTLPHPGLMSMHLRVLHPALSPADAAGLLAWAGTHLRYSLTLEAQ